MKIVKNFFIVFFVFSSIIVVAIWQFPASLAYRYFGDHLPSIRLNGLSGSIWNGQADDVTVFNQPAGKLQWRLHVLPLIEKEIVADVLWRYEQLNAKGQVARGSSGEISVRNINAQFPADRLSLAIRSPSYQLAGMMQVNIDKLVVKGTVLQQLHGNALWKSAEVSSAAKIPLGEIHAEFSSLSEGNVTGVINELSGPMKIDGTFQLQSGKIEAAARLAPKNKDPQLMENLRHFAQPQTDGSFLLSYQTELFHLF